MPRRCSSGSVLKASSPPSSKRLTSPEGSELLAAALHSRRTSSAPPESLVQTVASWDKILVPTA